MAFAEHGDNNDLPIDELKAKVVTESSAIFQSAVCYAGAAYILYSSHVAALCNGWDYSARGDQACHCNKPYGACADDHVKIKILSECDIFPSFHTTSQHCMLNYISLLISGQHSVAQDWP